MRAAGIICEYNPFHRGHAWHLAETKARTGAEAVVCVMSGAFVQRGEAAILREQARAEAAVKSGADLVLALPVPWAAASAGRFAMGGVSVLDRLAICDWLSFGSECGDAAALARVAEALEQEETQAQIRLALETGCSYAAAQQIALEKLNISGAALLQNPNNTLGIEYIRAIRALNADLTPIAVPRLGEHDSIHTGEGFASASHIRGLLQRSESVDAHLPAAMAEILRRERESGFGPVNPAALEQGMLYRLRTMTDAEYEALPDGGEGLWQRLAGYGRREATLEAVLDGAKTKRYAHARLRRMVLAAFLGIPAGMQDRLPPYTRVLAMNDTGAKLLAQCRKTAKIPILTKPAAGKAFTDFAAEVLALEARAADLWALALPDAEKRSGGMFWKTSPILTGGKIR